VSPPYPFSRRGFTEPTRLLAGLLMFLFPHFWISSSLSLGAPRFSAFSIFPILSHRVVIFSLVFAAWGPLLFLPYAPFSYVRLLHLRHCFTFIYGHPPSSPRQNFFHGLAIPIWGFFFVSAYAQFTPRPAPICGVVLLLFVLHRPPGWGGRFVVFRCSPSGVWAMSAYVSSSCNFFLPPPPHLPFGFRETFNRVCPPPPMSRRVPRRVPYCSGFVPVSLDYGPSCVASIRPPRSASLPRLETPLALVGVAFSSSFPTAWFPLPPFRQVRCTGVPRVLGWFLVAGRRPVFPPRNLVYSWALSNLPIAFFLFIGGCPLVSLISC